MNCAKTPKIKKMPENLHDPRHYPGFLQVSLPHLLHNLKYYQAKLAPGVQTMVVLKAQAYGHGYTAIAKYLEQAKAVGYFAVAQASEGAILREAGIGTPILVLNAAAHQASFLARHRLEAEVYSLAQLQAYTQSGHRLKIHLKIETGMHRLGLQEQAIPKAMELLEENPQLEVTGIMSHLAVAGSPEQSDFTHQQIAKFEQLSTTIEQILGVTTLKHLANSQGIQNYPQAHFNAVRLGLAFYGGITDGKNLKPAATWHAYVMQVKDLQAGDTVGYGRAFTAPHRMKMAVVSVGYADGFRRSLSQGQGAVYIRGYRCPTLGNVCMDTTMVDVSAVPELCEGDAVEIMGPHQSVTELAQNMQTIPYEVLTGIGERVKRVYVGE
jgi:alanine racemase